MKRKIQTILFIFYFLCVCILIEVNMSAAEEYTYEPTYNYLPLTEVSARALLNKAYKLFKTEFPNPNFEVLLVNSECNYPEYWESKGIKSLEPMVWILGIGYPINVDVDSGQYDNNGNHIGDIQNSDNQNGPKQPLDVIMKKIAEGKITNVDKVYWTVPRIVVSDPDIPIYFMFNTDYINTMNDDALLGIMIHDIGHLWDWKCGFTTNNISLMRFGGYTWREKMNDSYIIASKEEAIIPLYQFALWAENIGFPPINGIPRSPTFTPSDIRQFFFRDVNYALLLLSEEELKIFMGPILWDTYQHLLKY